MKTLTELSGSLIRMAANAVEEAKRSLPQPERPREPDVQARPAPAIAAGEVPSAPDAAAQQPAAEPPVEAKEPIPENPTAEGATAEAKEPAPDSSTAESAPAQAKGSDEKKAATAPEVESEAVKAALDEAVAKKTGVSGERLTLLRNALQAVGRRTEDVRLVRVFSLEEKVGGAKTVGNFQFVVDYSPKSMVQNMSAPKSERGGRGRGGGHGGHSGGGGGAKTSTSGGFSMDSLREDRKGQRGGRGRPGGGRKPGGGRPGGGSGT